MTKGQKIQKAMERILNPKPRDVKTGKFTGSGNLATTLPRNDNPLQNTNNPPTA